MKAENVQVQFEIENDRKIVLVLDRKTDCILLPWQDAFTLAETLDLVIKDASNENDVIDPNQLIKEQEQIRINTYRGNVALIFDHTDRVKFSWRAGMMIRDAIKIKAQDLQYEKRMVVLPKTDLRGIRKLLKKIGN